MKYFFNRVRSKNMAMFVHWEQCHDMHAASYNAKFENLLCIALLLLATKEEKALSSKMP